MPVLYAAVGINLYLGLKNNCRFISQFVVPKPLVFHRYASGGPLTIFLHPVVECAVIECVLIVDGERGRW